jgi:hypothetical protein
MGFWVAGVWDLKWRRELFVWEVDLRDELMRDLNFVQISNAQDIWVWEHESNGIFSVKSAYSVLELAYRAESAPPTVPSFVLANVWKSGASSKVIVFSWQLLQNKIPSRQNLFRISIITDINNIVCVFCGTPVPNVQCFLYGVVLHF